MFVFSFSFRMQIVSDILKMSKRWDNYFILSASADVFNSFYILLEILLFISALPSHLI